MDWNATVMWRKLEDVDNVQRTEQLNKGRPIEQLGALGQDHVLFFHEVLYEEHHERVEALSENPPTRSTAGPVDACDTTCMHSDVFS